MESNVSSTPLKPTAIELRYDGLAYITLKASVVDSQKFHFSVPREQMQRVLDSLQLSDSRGNTLNPVFPAPILTPINDFSVNSQDAWNDLVLQHQGSQVQLRTKDDYVQGNLVGVKWETPKDDPKAQVLLLYDSKVTAHPVDSVQSVSFKDSSRIDELNKFVSDKNQKMEYNKYYRITINTSGTGHGHITASYTQYTESSTPFEISYLAHADEHAPVTGSHPNMIMKWFALVVCPLHYDINDVDLTLRGNLFRENVGSKLYPNTFTTKQNDSFTPGSGYFQSYKNNSDKNSTNDGSYAETISSEINIENDDFVDDDTFLSTCSAVASNMRGDTKLGETRKISIKAGKCTKIELCEKRYEGGLVHFCRGARENSSTDVEYCLMIDNTGNTHLEAGRGTFHDKEGYTDFVVNGTRRDGGYFCVLDYNTGCSAKSTRISNLEEIISRKFENNKLKVNMIVKRVITYDFQNKENRDIDLFVQHDSDLSSLRVVDIEAKLCKEGSDEQVIIEPTWGSKGPRWIYYKLMLEAKEKYRLVVHEHVTKTVTIDILNNYCSRSITIMELNKIIDAKIAEKLRELVRMGRERTRVQTERKLCSRKIIALKKLEKEKADETNNYQDQKIANGDSTQKDRDEEMLFGPSRRKFLHDMEMLEERVDRLVIQDVTLKKEIEKKLKAIQTD